MQLPAQPVPGRVGISHWPARRAVLGGLGGLAAAVLAPPSANAVTGGKELPDALEDLPRNAKKAR